MTTKQRNENRQLYNQLRLAISFPGEIVGDMRRKYQPVNKDGWSWETAMSAPDTPMVAQHRRHEIGMRFMLGMAS